MIGVTDPGFTAHAALGVNNPMAATMATTTATQRRRLIIVTPCTPRSVMRFTSPLWWRLGDTNMPRKLSG
jgi:hypothetical protein